MGNCEFRWIAHSVELNLSSLVIVESETFLHLRRNNRAVTALPIVPLACKFFCPIVDHVMLLGEFSRARDEISKKLFPGKKMFWKNWLAKKHEMFSAT